MLFIQISCFILILCDTTTSPPALCFPVCPALISLTCPSLALQTSCSPAPTSPLVSHDVDNRVRLAGYDKLVMI